MPGGDRTGPLGQGPQTGRAAGRCAGYDMPGYMNPVPGGGYRGMGRGGGWSGGGRGWRHWFYATGLTGWQRGGGRGRGRWPFPPYPVAHGVLPPTREQELSVLQADLRSLEETAEQLRRRIEELKAQPPQPAGA